MSSNDPRDDDYTQQQQQQQQQGQKQQHQKQEPTEKELREARRQELKGDLATLERGHVRSRWVSDKGAMRRNKEVRFQEKFNRNAPRRLAKHDMFMKPEAGHGGLETERGEVTDRVTQQDILESVDLQTQRKKFALHLDKLGPYTVNFSRNGTHMCFAGLRGHVASMRWQDFALDGETQLRDRCHDITYLVDHSMFAVAQNKYTYMYTSKCVEMHVLPKFANVTKLAYLPRHMLLVGASSQYSTMQWMDIGTGEEVANKPPALVQDPTLSLTVNPANGVAVTGDTRGLLKMWSPTVPEPLVQIKAHRGGVSHMVVHPGGRYTASCGADNSFKIWDIRTLRPLEEWKMSYVVDSMDVSQSGMVAIAGGTNVQVWRGMFHAAGQKPFRPWLKHSLGYGNAARTVKFCPFEDVLAIGHSQGICSMLVPGAGEPNPDFYEADVYETDVHRKERVVRNLLDKLPPDTISLDLQIANVDEERLAEYQAALQANRKARNIREKKEKKQQRGNPPGGDAAAHGLDTMRIGADVDEVDEDLGVEEKGPSRLWKSKKEMLKEKKMVRWDQKDSVDKVRSKQTLRHSRNVMQLRKRRRYLESLKEEHDSEKKQRAAAALGEVGGKHKGGGGGDDDDDSAVINLLGGGGAADSGNNKKKQKFSVGDSKSAGQLQVDGKTARRRNRSAASEGGEEESSDFAVGDDLRASFRERRKKVGNAALKRFVE